MESERPIEKLLRACALKRRQADLPTELHPATRKLLQGEVLRQFGQATQKSPPQWWSFIAAWPKLAWGGAATAVVAAILGVVIIALPGHKDDSALLASRELAPAPDAIPANESKPTDAESLAPEAAKDKSLQVAQSKGLRSDLARPAEPTAAPAPASPPATLAQSSDLSKTKAELQDRLAVDKRLDLAANQPAAPPPAAAAPAGMLGGAAGAAPSEPSRARYGLALQSQTGAPAVSTAATSREEAPLAFEKEMTSLKAQIAQQPSPTANVLFADQTRRAGTQPQGQLFLRTRTAAAGAAQASSPENAVLVSFRVEPTDRGVRVIDADGSVYSGSLQALAPTATPALTEGIGRMTNRRFGSSVPTGTATALRDTKNAYAFHVVGTNATLRQKVDFAGQFWPTTNLTAFSNLNATSMTTASGVGSPTNSPTSWLLLNSEISGKALINGRRQVDVKAAPVKP